MEVVYIDNGRRKMSFGGLMSICGVGGEWIKNSIWTYYLGNVYKPSKCRCQIDSYVFMNLELRGAFWARGLNVRVVSEKMFKAMGMDEIA